jgi:hypothetical protein
MNAAADNVDIVTLIGNQYFVDGVLIANATTTSVLRLEAIGLNGNDFLVVNTPMFLPRGVRIRNDVEVVHINGEISGVTPQPAGTPGAAVGTITIDSLGGAGEGLFLGANLRTIGADVTINKVIALTADAQIVTDDAGGGNSAGNVTLQRLIHGFRNFTIDARSDTGTSGNITLQGNVGTTTPLASFTAITGGNLDWRVPTTIRTDSGKVELNAATVQTNSAIEYLIDTETGGNGNGGNVVLTGAFVDTTPLGSIRVDVNGGAANTPGMVTVPAGFNNTGVVAGHDIYKNAAGTYQIRVTPPGVAGVLFSENFNAPLVNPNLANLVTRSGTFFQSGNAYVGLRPGYLGKAVATIEGLTLPAHYEVQATVNMNPPGNGIFSNGFIIFDYQSPTNFKFAGAFVGRKTFSIGQVTNGAMNYLIETAAPALTAGVNVNLRLDINGLVTTLFANGVQVATRTFTTAFTGKVGIGTDNANTTFDNIVVRSA